MMADKKRKKRIIFLSVSVICVFLFLLLIILLNGRAKIYFDEENSKIKVPSDRSTPKYTMILLEEYENYTIYRVIYESESFLNNNGIIYGILYMPKSREIVPGFVFLPGGSVTKEAEPAGEVIANLGYAVLVIDQRGIGETGGFYPSFDQDRLIFQSKKESIQHLGVYDALRAVDLLKDIDKVDKDKIMIGGSSMGGRYALIAAAIDQSIKSVLIISSAGFHVEESSLKDDSYFLSIDPDRYIQNISPRKIVMIHSLTDEVVKIGDAAKTFSLAVEPRNFYTVSNCAHGYCEDMLKYIEDEFGKLYEEQSGFNLENK